MKETRRKSFENLRDAAWGAAWDVPAKQTSTSTLVMIPQELGLSPMEWKL